MTAWWQFPITQAHGVNGEQGVDFGVPFHTPLTPILPGRVQRVDCSSGWRCEVDIATTYNGQPAIESFLHIDQPLVSAGQMVDSSTVVGLSGGQTSGGSNPDSTQYSTGPHTEFDIFMGSQPWQNAIDPTSLALGGPKAGSGAGSGSSSGSSTSSSGSALDALGALGQGFQNLANALNPATALGNLSSAITGKSNVQDFLFRALLVGGGIVLLAFAFLALMQGGGEQATQPPAEVSPMRQRATEAAEAAAVA